MDDSLVATTKVCTKCGEEKPLDAYYNGDGKHGKKQPCKACVRVYNAANRQSINKRKREKRAAHRSEHPILRHTRRIGQPNARAKKAEALRKSGLTYASIGGLMGVSAARAYQLVLRAKVS